jgi:hypothetical protein
MPVTVVVALRVPVRLGVEAGVRVLVEEVVCGGDSVPVPVKELVEVLVLLWVNVEVPVAVPVFEELAVPVCVKEGVTVGLSVWDAVPEGEAVSVVVDVLDQGVPVVVTVALLDPVVLLLPVILDVIVPV